MDFSKRIYYLLLAVIVVLLLIYAESLLIPFVLAILIWFVIRVLKSLLRRAKFTSKWPNWLMTALSAILLISLLSLTVSLISSNIQQLSRSIPSYEKNINDVAKKINETFDIDLVKSMTDTIRDFNFSEILSSLFSALTSIFGNAFLILIYLVFILMEETIFNRKLKTIYSDKKQYDRVTSILEKIDSSINNYIAIKTLTSLTTGFLSFFVLYFVGVDAPFFWAFIIFVLNYIPNIGSLIATLFPTVFALLQFGDLTHALLVLIIVGAIQLTIGSLVEPRIMGNTLNMSPLVVFLTLALWGTIWGVTGMLLSVPITVIIILILNEFPGTRSIAAMLSRRGDPGAST
ncbi:MAG TPA: AI-2E family transporter [Bacteroidales bacterium]|nr:AI-2E family transporter [Bacteroidales bacterium]